MGTGQKTAKTLVLGVVVMVVAGFAPAIAVGYLGWPNAANVAILSGLAIFIACMTGKGWHTGVVIAVPFAIFAGIVTWVGLNPWLAALVMALAAFLRGQAARVGLHNALVMTVISLGFLVASPVHSDTSLAAPLFVAVVALGAAMWSTLIMYMLRKRLHQHKLTQLDTIRVLAFSLALAVLVGVATWFVVDLDLGHTGAWIILTVLVVFQPYLGAGFKKALNRAGGTALGFVVAIAVGLVFPTGPMVYVIGFILLMAALVFLLQSRPYWQYATLLTPGIVLLESAGSTVDRLAEDRLAATLVGIVGTLLVILALSPFAKRLEVKEAPPHVEQHAG